MLNLKLLLKGLKRYWRKIEQIKTWYILIAFVLFLVLSIFFLRQNSLKTVELREEVLAADQKGENVKKELKELGGFIFSHMNTNIPPVELQASYDRAVEKARKQATESSNSQIYIAAQEACENPNIPLTARAQCIQDYVTNNAPPGTNPDVLQLPPKELYAYDFQAPVWSPDAAGFSVLLTVISGVLLTTRLAAYYFVKQSSKEL